MMQNPLPDINRFNSEPRLSILDDFGQMRNAGACLAHTVLAENGQQYIIKGPKLTPQMPYVAANEYIAASLARLLGLPVLDFCLAELGDQLFFASLAMPDQTFYQITTEDLFLRCENVERVYALLIFDAWICNEDRHERNLLVRRVPATGNQERLLLLLNDHSHCLMDPCSGVSPLPDRLSSSVSRYCRLDFLRSSIKVAARLSSELEAVERIKSAKISEAVHATPDDWLRQDEKDAVEAFLLERRTRLRSILAHERSSFSNLGSGII